MHAKDRKKATDIVPSISSTAAYVLGNICRICAESMPSEVLSVYESIGQHGLELKDEVFVIEGMSSIVSKLPPAEASKGLERLLSPMAIDLRVAIDKNSAELIVRSLEHMVAVFKYAKLSQSPQSAHSRGKQMPSGTSTGININTEHPVLLLMRSVWHLFEEIIVKFYENQQVMEKLCRVYKHSVRNAKNSFFPLLEKLLEQMVDVFSKCPISSFLYTCSICVGEFGSPSMPYNTFEVRLRVFQTYRALNECMCRHLTTIESFANNPCLVEDYFNLSNRVCKMSNEFFLHTDNKDVVSICLKLGCVGLRLDHPDAWPTVSCFFHTFLTSFDDSNASKRAQNVGNERQMYFIEVVRLHCRGIIDSLLYCTAGGLNPRFIDDDSNDDSVCVAELFYLLLKFNPDMVCNVILECGKIEEQQPGGSRAIPSSIANQNDFYSLATQLRKSSEARDVYNSVWDFHTLCRENNWKFKRENANKSLVETK